MGLCREVRQPPHHSGSSASKSGGIGVVVVLTITVVTLRLGAAATIGLLIAGQLAMGVAIDRYGWFGVDQVALTWPRALGVLLLAAGALPALRR